MTIEIKQLVIRAIVEERRELAPRPAAPRNPVVLEQVGRIAAPADAGLDREALIAECTRQVMRELQRGRGR
jgi:hypothetical protein